MKIATIVFERVPMVWFLLGLLFNAAGLYLGFEFGLAFVYMMVGWFCCAYGLTLYIFRLREKPKKSEARRLSPHFISAGATTVFPSPKAENSRPTERAEA
jgi:hypothetical protein